MTPEPDPDTARIELALSDASAVPGELVFLELTVLSELELSSLSLAIDFDETRLRFEGVRPVVPEGVVDFVPASPSTHENNDDDVVGDQVEEGWIHIVFTPTEDGAPVVPELDSPTPLLRLWFRVRDDAQAGRAAVRFEDIGPVRVEDRTEDVRNIVGVETGLVDAIRELRDDEVDDGFVIIEGVIGEVGFFLRGDANMDCTRDISDAVRVLQYLFTGEAELLCEDAADSDDNALLNLSDPVFTLNWLFLQGRDFPFPFEQLAEDPTQDYELFCFDGFLNAGSCGGS